MPTANKLKTMTLVVGFQEFSKAVKMYGDCERCCVMHKRVGDSVHLTYMNPDTGVQVVSVFSGKEDEAVGRLREAGFETMQGTWVTEASLEHLASIAGDTYIGAVAYQTKEGPGLWIDAFASPPLDGTVLRRAFDEFVAEGYLDADEFETFVHDARPLVRILTPRDIETFLRQKQS